MIKTVKKILISFICSIPFLTVWCMFIYGLSFFEFSGGLEGFDYVFGKYIYIILILVGTVILTSVIYLRFFIKKELYIQLIAITSTIVFGVIIYILVMITQSEFLKFSTEKFIQYPGQRLTMYYDFVEKYDIKGYSCEDIEKLLGKPQKADLENEVLYAYPDGHGNSVIIIFENGKVKNFYCSE